LWKGFDLEMTKEQNSTLALFYCQNTPKSNEEDRQSLEERYGNSLRLFPIPCSGRLEPLHLLKALEEFADAAFVITCPEYWPGRGTGGDRYRLKRRGQITVRNGPGNRGAYHPTGSITCTT
jgi:hypothetical protein